MTKISILLIFTSLSFPTFAKEKTPKKCSDLEYCIECCRETHAQRRNLTIIKEKNLCDKVSPTFEEIQKALNWSEIQVPGVFAGLMQDADIRLSYIQYLCSNTLELPDCIKTCPIKK